MKRAIALALALAPLTAAAESRQERAAAIAEQEARRADERARTRPSDRLANPVELALFERLEELLGLSLLVEPISEDVLLEKQRRLEALRALIFERLLPLDPEDFEALARAIGAERAVEHRLVRLELARDLTRAALTRLLAELDDARTVRAVIFVHGAGTKGAKRAADLEALLGEADAFVDRRISIERSGLTRGGATIYLMRLRPTS